MDAKTGPDPPRRRPPGRDGVSAVAAIVSTAIRVAAT
jgi:hypothetical protein